MKCLKLLFYGKVVTLVTLPCLCVNELPPPPLRLLGRLQHRRLLPEGRDAPSPPPPQPPPPPPVTGKQPWKLVTLSLPAERERERDESGHA